jgi:adenine-specific DNA-methyltransferase
LGIHSYLAYLRDRLAAARELLTETGSLFVQIGDENIHLVRCLLDEIFGSENCAAQIAFKSTDPLGQKGLPQAYDYLLWYAKDIACYKYRPIFKDRDITDDSEYRLVENTPLTARRLSEDEFKALHDWSGVFRRRPLTSSGFTESCTYTFELGGKRCSPFGSGKSWSTHSEGMERLKWAGRLFLIGPTPYMKAYYHDYPVNEFENVWTDKPGAVAQVYVVQTATKFIERCLLMTTDAGDLVLDPTCGSGTTAYVAEQWGRRWITIDTSRVALALARTRLMASKFPYFLLADSPEGVRKEAVLTGQVPPPHETEGDIRKGFVYKRVPHVTLKSIANNPDIKEGMTRAQIDQAIARHAEQETLYDKPYEDSSRVRVAGPFTVESLSPHRVLATDEDRPRGEADGANVATTDFATMILDNLKKAGVQNTVKNERLKFDTLEPYAGTWLQAVGRSIGADGKSVRVAVSIGPEHGTVGPQQVKEAAKEAVQGVGFQILVVCGFAFDAHVSEEVRRYGKLTVLPARINPDLLISSGNEALLKNTGAGNLFMVFGEPDIDVRLKNGTVIVELKGVDVYDPTTGQIRNSSTDDIACWFIDTDYNGESFFVRHAYFTGADEPYDKLKRALKAEIDESAWSSLYSTVSRPFPKPPSKKIAVKVINHYGDEVLKVIALK